MNKAEETLKNSLLDAMIDGVIGSGIVVSVADLKTTFSGQYSDNYLNTFLANSEMEALTSGYPAFTSRIGEGLYRIHPVELLYRMRDRKLV
jgi:hypothetical protein